MKILLLLQILQCSGQLNYYGSYIPSYQTYDIRLVRNYGQPVATYQPRNANPYSYSEPLGVPYSSSLTFRDLKPTYDFVSRPTYDYSIKYGYQPVGPSKPVSRSGYQTSTASYPIYSSGTGSYPGYTSGTGSYAAINTGHGYGYQTRNTYPVGMISYGSFRPFGKESQYKGQEEYEFTDTDDYVLKRDQDDDVSGYTNSYKDGSDGVSGSSELT